ncbi:MAG TPA: ATP-binding cassette domain-containing protein [Verrucomicrobiae bacterium]|nr:ATP-binding cassette domain-containing protein [Verrucomicrobiae bacterium]
MNKVMLQVDGLSKAYIIKPSPFARKHTITAVDNLSFEIFKEETLGFIGESGSGKTTTGSLILRLIRRDRGKVIFNGKDIFALDNLSMRNLRRDMQVIFQHSQNTLDPQMTVGELLEEPLKLHKIVESNQIEGEVGRLLDMVGISIRERNKFPYQLSGGQLQRVGIARAIASRPRFVICDEPVSALDVSIQGQILNLLMDLKKELKLTYLFISHDLRVVSHVSDRIAVLHRGKIVEIGDCRETMLNPQNPYTKELIGSMLNY